MTLEVTICEYCGSKLYNKFENGCSLTKCSGCNEHMLNGIGLPTSSKYCNLELASEAVFDTIDQANKAFFNVLQKRYSKEQLEQIAIEWHGALHDEVVK